jgi:phosphopantothenoylcysteine decarboxylase/phosphopantothenate--cysteine ligase
MMEQLALHMEWADVLIMAAAVCDMRPVHSEAQKIDKSHLHQITMMTNPDIVGTLAQSFPKVHIVSFSLENTFDPERPLKKMRAKKSNWVVYNQLSSMGSDASQFGVIDREGKAIIEAKSVDKELFANMLIDALQQELT